MVCGARRASERGSRRGGLPECPGGYMAKRWHGPLSEWTRRFRDWIDAPSPQALLEAAIFFDFRRVAGGLFAGAARRRARGGGGPSRVPPLPCEACARLPAAADAPPPPQGRLVGGRPEGRTVSRRLCSSRAATASRPARARAARSSGSTRRSARRAWTRTWARASPRRTGISSVFACGCSSAASRRASRSRTPSRSPSSPRSSARSSRTRCGR